MNNIYRNLSGYSKGVTLILFALIILFQNYSAHAEGTKQLKKSSAEDGGLAILTNSLFALWGGYGGTEDDRLNVRVGDFSNETIYLGFQVNPYKGGYSGNGVLPFDVAMRIVAPDGSEARGWQLLNSANAGYINNYAEAVAGPSTIDAAGYSPITFAPTQNGDYYIEFAFFNLDPGASAEAFFVDLFDVTVANTATNTAIDGRLWAKRWEIDAFDPVDGFYDFTASLYNYSSDSVVTQTNFSEFQPGFFSILSNQTGTGDTGDPLVDRASVTGNSGTPHYAIFLNSPDIAEFPSGVPGSILRAIEMLECVAGTAGNYCIEIESDKGGIAEVLLDFDSDGVLDVGTDILLTQYIDAGTNCVSWDGLDNGGTQVVDGTNFDIIATVSYGFTHLPMYDVEGNINGYDVNLVRPGTPGQIVTYWDDTNLPGGTADLDGCSPDLPLGGAGNKCHSWTFNATAGPTNFGDANTVNTWWSSNVDVSQITYTMVSNCTPHPGADSFDINENEILTGESVIGNDSDPNGDPIVINTTPVSGASGILTIYANGTFDYDPNGTTGQDTFTYEICDNGSPALCANAVVTININQLPTATDKVLTTMEETAVNIATIDLGYSDPDGDGLFSIDIKSLPAVGTLYLDANGNGLPDAGEEVSLNQTIGIADLNTGNLYFMPDTNGEGNNYASFDFNVSDGAANAIADNTISFNVTQTNDAPVATAENLTTDEETAVNGDLSDNATDIDGDNLSFSVIAGTAPAVNEGTLVFNPDGTFVFTPAADFNGNVIFDYEVCDDGTPTLCDSETVTITVGPVNDAPVATAENLTTDEETAVNGDLSDNATDIDGDNLSFSVVTAPAANEGTLVFNPDGTFVFTPAADFNGNVTFDYEVCDDGTPTLCDSETVTITVGPVNDAPVATVENLTTDEETAVNGDLSD
ncbi:MAG: Ig-like domain-containing protein, partial [Cyclobacteriaceae bacterium]